MADELLTTIGISAKADTTQAVKGLEALTKTLERLQSVTKGAGNINIGDSLASFSSAMASFKPISAGVIPKALPERLEALGRALDSFDTTKLREISKTLAQIGVAGSLASPVIASVTQSIVSPQAPVLEDITKESTTATGVLQQLQYAVIRLTDSLQNLKETAKKAGQATKEAGNDAEKSKWDSLKDKIGGVTAKLGGFFSALKRIAVYRAIRFVLKEITQGFREGIQNLYQYSALINGKFKDSMDRLSTSALYLKNSLGAMVAPIINALTPAIETLVDAFVDLLNVINETLAMITGADTWTKALKYPKQYAEELDGANGSAKALRATLLGFDEINRLDDNSRGSRGRASDLMDYSKMFEEVATKNFWDSFMERGKSKFTLFAGSLAGILALKLSGAFEGVVTGTSATTLLGKFGAVVLASYGGFRIGNWLYENNVFHIRDVADDLMDAGLGDAITKSFDTVRGLWDDYVNWWTDNVDLSLGWDLLYDDAVTWGDKITGFFGGVKEGWSIMYDDAITWGDKLWDAWDWLTDDGIDIHFHTSVDSEAWDTFKNNVDSELQQIRNAHQNAFDFEPTGTGTAPPYPTPNAHIYKEIDDVSNKNKTNTEVQVIKKAGNALVKNMENLLGGLASVASNNSLLTRAGGGSVATGDLFLANEKEPELIAHLGNRTQVANSDQITESIKVATMAGNAEGNGLLRQVVTLLNGILQKDNVVVAEVTTDSITSGLDRQNRRNGRTTVPVGV